MPYTPEQEAAIRARNPRLLVSAAAGSGKTAVLIERIATLLRQGEAHVDRLLVCTFTRAAAGEMRERLEVRLSDAALADPRMRRELDRLDTAQIGTLHSFCGRVAREFFQAADIDPQAAVCDDVTAANLLAAAVEETLDAGYAAHDADIDALTARFADRELQSMLPQLYHFLMGLPDPFDWLDAQLARDPAEQLRPGGALSDTLCADCGVLLSGAQAFWREARDLCASPECPEKLAPVIASDGDRLLALRDALENGLPALIAQLDGLRFDRFPTVKATDEPTARRKEQVKALRDGYKKLVEQMEKLLPADAAAAAADMESMRPALRGLAKLARDLHQRLTERKRDRALLTFDDTEHLALRILRDPELAGVLRARYDAVFVDEYQDVSALQDAILSALCGDALPLFMVGDVKQSIYRFRQAEPGLFLEKLRRYGAEPDAACRRISLNRNFRSREGVLAAVNAVFERVMDGSVTEIDYDDEARLYAGLPSRGDPATLLHVLPSRGVRAAQKPAREAALIAREIAALVGSPKPGRDGQPDGTYTYKDIAILAPVGKGVSDAVTRALTDAGVPVYSEESAGVWQQDEVMQAVAHLRLMDSRLDDLSLLTVLRGPAFGFSEQELAEIRLLRPEKGASFLDALLTGAEPGNAALTDRCAHAVQTLRHERFLLTHTPFGAYLWDYLHRSGMYGYYGAQPGGRLRQANLRLLCHQLDEFEQNRGGDLGEFLQSVTAVGGVEDRTSPAVLSPWENVVRVMTIHKSKGLEFPVVFLMDMGRALHRPGGAPALSLHPRVGAALRYVNPAARAKRQTLGGAAVALRQRAEETAERARLLYVAMTRARDQVILVGHAPARQPANWLLPRTPYRVWEAGSMLDWLCQTACDLGADPARMGDCQALENSTYTPWKTSESDEKSTVPTDNPQERGVWRVVFHNSPEHEDEARRAELAALAADAEASVATEASGGGDSATIASPFASDASDASEADAPEDDLAADPERARQAREAALRADALRQELVAEVPYAEAVPPLGPAQATFVADGFARDPSSPLPDSGEAVAAAAAAACAGPAVAAPDPLVPALRYDHLPFKIGVTALCRALAEPGLAEGSFADSEAAASGAAPLGAPIGDSPFGASPLAALAVASAIPSGAAPLGTSTASFGITPLPAFEDADAPAASPAEETAATKRLPLSAQRPRLLGDLPALPSFLRPPVEQTGLQIGVSTHKALGLLPFAPLREALPGGPEALREAVRAQLDALLARGLLSPPERAAVAESAVADFYLSPLGGRALRAPECHREWAFNLRVRQPFDGVVQGVVDLCFREPEGWVLVDYKTDAVRDADALRSRYRAQVAYYRRALTATGRPVREALLYSLSLRQAVAL